MERLRQLRRQHGSLRAPIPQRQPLPRPQRAAGVHRPRRVPPQRNIPQRLLRRRLVRLGQPHAWLPGAGRPLRRRQHQPHHDRHPTPRPHRGGLRHPRPADDGYLQQQPLVRPEPRLDAHQADAPLHGRHLCLRRPQPRAADGAPLRRSRRPRAAPAGGQGPQRVPKDERVAGEDRPRSAPARQRTPRDGCSAERHPTRQQFAGPHARHGRRMDRQSGPVEPLHL